MKGILGMNPRNVVLAALLRLATVSVPASAQTDAGPPERQHGPVKPNVFGHWYEPEARDARDGMLRPNLYACRQELCGPLTLQATGGLY